MISYELLWKIDNGYKATEAEKHIIEAAENIYWSFQKIKTIPKSIIMLKSLKKLSIVWCKELIDISSLSGLRHLINLDLSFNTNLTDISPLNNLPNLNRLDLYQTKVRDISALANATSMKNLELGYTNITNISPLYKLKKLSYLGLSHTDIKDIKVLSGLTMLTVLDLRHTLINDISALSNLTNLSNIDLSNSQHITDISALSELKKLESLDLGNTRVDNISNLSGLSRLTNIELQYSNVSDISVLANLTTLVKIGLRATNVSDISAISGLKCLKNLDLRNTTISFIPESLIDLNLEFTDEKERGVSGIYIRDLQLTNQPIEIFEWSRDLIRAYYREEKTVPVNECKVIFLGDAEAGKTYSIKRLLNNGEFLDEFDGNSTPGIDISVNSVYVEESAITVNYWDFGGQEIQHSMHRMFLTERTVYVVFLNARQDPLDDRARYWMENIKSFAPNAPVLIVINKMDQNSRPKFNEDGIRENYKNNIKEIVRMSALKDYPDDFMSALQGNINSIIKNLAVVKSEIPYSWKRLMEDIRNMPNNYINATDFKNRCVHFRVKNYQEIHDDLVNLFQTIGVSFCYYQNRSLSDYIILNPRWLVNALYTIISNSNAVAKNGIISQRDLFDLLQKDTVNETTVRRVVPDLRYKDSEINYILGVIRMFQLSYPLKDGSEFFPMLCDGNEKISALKVVSVNSLHFIFRYKYLPANVMHRLIVDMQRDLVYQYVWYSGAVFKNESHQQLAYIHTIGSDLHVYVEGKDDYYSPNEYLTPIQSIIREINKDMNLVAKEYVRHIEEGLESEFSLKAVKRNLENGIYRGYDETNDIFVDYRDVVRRYENTAPKIKGDLLPNILKALSLMQNMIDYHRNADNSNRLEDLRNEFVSSQVAMTGYNCNDQQTGGYSERGKQTGKRDIVFRDKNGKDILVYEGLNSTGSNTKNLHKHLSKLIKNYNPQGLPYGILTTYLDCSIDKYKALTDRYKEHLDEYAPDKCVCVGSPREISTYSQLIRCLEMNYESGSLFFTIYHIIVGMV